MVDVGDCVLDAAPAQSGELSQRFVISYAGSDPSKRSEVTLLQVVLTGTTLSSSTKVLPLTLIVLLYRGHICKYQRHWKQTGILG